MTAKTSGTGINLQTIIQLVERSGAFDKKFYLDQLEKTGNKQNDPIKHYLFEGWKLGLNPHPCFDTSFYLKSHKDVQDSGLHPFLHFILYGHREPRKTRPDFYLPDYKTRHPEINALNVNPLKHFTERYGQGQSSLASSQGPVTARQHEPQDRETASEEHFLTLAQERGLFDAEWYANTYGGNFDNPQQAFKDYLHKSRFSPVNPSPRFDNETYHRLHIDVYHEQSSPLLHYLSRGEQQGRQYSPVTQKWHPRNTLDLSPTLPLQAYFLKIAVCLHIYYSDYIERFAKALEHFPTKVDVLITLADARHEQKARQVFGSHPRVKQVEIRCVPNRGRNFGPLLVEYSTKLQEYDLFCHLHSKKSLYSGREQTQWADYLSEYLLRDPSVVTRILGAFVEHKDLGLYYPTTFWMMPSWVNHVTMNKGFLKQWQERLGLAESHDFLSYPAGGMFWARPQALKGLLDREYLYDDFPQEPLPNDGSMLHALERVIGTLAEHNGYRQFFYYPATGQFTTDQSYIMASYHNSLEKMRPHLGYFSHLSFDVFDTLVRRKYTAADYAKLKLGQELEKRKLVPSAKDFVALRNDVELELRKRSNFKGDVRIDSIYSEIGIRLKIKEQEAQRLMQREFELDLDMILPKDEMVDLFNNLGSTGHILWVISDTYYTREQIGLMLRKAGITAAYRLLVSSEEQKRKDNGTMWHMVKSDLEREGVTSYIHIGDNVVADAQLPGDLGLTTFHILHPMDKWRALGFPAIFQGDLSLNEHEILKWGRLVSCIGRTPFLGD